MGKLHRAVLLLAAILFAAVAQAQEFPRNEFFGGFSYANLNLAPQAVLFSPTGQSYYGADVALSANPRKNIRVLADWGFQRGSSPPKLDFFTEIHGPFVSEVHVFATQALFGPQFVFRRPKETIFVNALVGVAYTQWHAKDTFGTFSIGPVRRTSLALGFGGGLDVNWTHRIAIRVFQADYIPNHGAGTWEQRYSVSTGIVFKSGYRAKPSP